MPPRTESFKHLLKANRYSVTKARLTVFNALLGEEPMSMHELVGRARGIDRASVYRAVDLFEKLDVVQRLNTGWKYKLELSDKFNEHHHHLTCTRCGRTVSLNESDMEQLIAHLARSHGYTPTAHQIEIQGLCAQCR